ncbi:hypothetical protein, partial [Morganella morganii]
MQRNGILSRIKLIILLELYCGNGNFTLPLSLKFKRVLATELAKSSVH